MKTPSRIATAPTDAAAEAHQRRLPYPLGSGQAEELALAGGLKPAVRQLLQPTEVEAAARRFSRAGWEMVIPGFRLVREQDRFQVLPVEEAPAGLVPVFVGRDRARLEEAAACESARDETASRAMGRLLGYPECCIEGYLEAPRPRSNLALAAAAWTRTSGSPLPRLNGVDLAIFHFLPWAPCTYRCDASLRYADAVAALVARQYPQFVIAIDSTLAAHRLVVSDEVQVSIRGQRTGDEIALERVWPSAVDRHPAAALSEASAASIARLLVSLRAGERLRVAEGRATVDGVPLEGGERFLLVPFGG
jgi:hypothetical protein